MGLWTGAGLVVVVMAVAGCADAGSKDAGLDDVEVAGVVLDENDPALLVLDETVGEVGISHAFGEDGVEIGSGQVLETDPVTRPLVADVLVTDDGARCRATLAAPPDRALAARGELALTLVVEGRDGQVRRVPREVVDVDVTVDAGERWQSRPGPLEPVVADEVSTVSCEAVHRPE